MSKVQINLQDGFLNQARKDCVEVVIFLVNGFKIKGYVKGFDNFTILVEVDKTQEMIYKHAVSTIAPTKPISLISLKEENL